MLFEELKQRRTIRKYTGEDIPEKLLNELIETACRVSTTGNMQLYSIIITRDKEMKEKLAPAHFNQPTVTSAPVVLTFCADFNRFIKWCDWRQLPIIFYSGNRCPHLCPTILHSRRTRRIRNMLSRNDNIQCTANYRNVTVAQVCNSGNNNYCRLSIRNPRTGRTPSFRSNYTSRKI